MNGGHQKPPSHVPEANDKGRKDWQRRRGGVGCGPSEKESSSPSCMATVSKWSPASPMTVSSRTPPLLPRIRCTGGPSRVSSLRRALCVRSARPKAFSRRFGGEHFRSVLTSAWKSWGEAFGLCSTCHAHPDAPAGRQAQCDSGRTPGRRTGALDSTTTFGETVAAALLGPSTE